MFGKIAPLLVLIFIPFHVFCQKNIIADSNFIFWSQDRILKVEDFNIITSPYSGSYIHGHITYDYKNLITTFGFGFSKDYKKKIRNYFIKSASWIDTTHDVYTNLLYQQTAWNLLEVYVRQLRKSIYENRKQLKTQQAYDDINTRIINAFSKRQVEYETSTAFATIDEKQKEWEDIIIRELEQLKDYAAE